MFRSVVISRTGWLHGARRRVVHAYASLAAADVLVAVIAVALVTAFGAAPLLAQERGGGKVGDLILGDDDREEDDMGRVLVTRLRVDGGLLDDDAVDAWERSLDHWLEREPDVRTVIVRLDSRGTPGGDVAPAERVAKRVQGLRGVRTIAHIEPGGQAANAAALVPLACHDIAMAQDARIGYVDDPETAVPDDDENAARKTRGLFGEVASVRRTSFPSELARAFVSRFHSPVYKVTYEKREGDNKVTEVEILTKDVLDARQAKLVERVKRPIKEQQVIAERGTYATLTAKEAREYHLAAVLTSLPFEDGGRAELLGELRIHVGNEDVIDEERGALKPHSATGQTAVNVLNHPVTRFFLLVIGFLGLVLELKMPGTLIPISCSAFAFLLFFLGGCFPAFDVTGANVPTTSAFEIVLFLVGLGLLLTELFLLPGVVLFGVLGLVLVVVSITLAMMPPSGAGSADSLGFRSALLLLFLALGSGFGIFFALVRVLPRTSLFGRGGLVLTAAIKGVPNADSLIQAQQREAEMIGRVGIAVTPLRPAGKIEVEGRVLDVVAEGDYIDKDQRVTIVEVSSIRTLVRPAP